MNEFEQIASQRRSGGIVRELWDFLRENKKWWLAPLIVTILLLALTAYLTSSAAAPFIYSLF